jgi:guanylate kinase
MSNEARDRRGLLLVISSPSGAGKSSLARRLMASHPAMALSVSATTRSPRPGEADGREYRFLTRGAFDEMAAVGDFLEWAEVHEHRYGTPRAPVMAALARGQDMLFDIDWQGAEKIAMSAPGDTVRVFILPPNMAELAARLHSRAQDAEDVIARRLGRAKGEIEKWVDYDYVIVNDDFDRALGELEAIYRTERMRPRRNPWLAPFVQRLHDQKV